MRRQPGDADRAGGLLVIALLTVASLAVFIRVAHYPFVAYDDPLYVAENSHVREGISVEGLAWAFRSTDAANWHPLTWISHMADVELFGLDPGPHHAVNVLIHLANALLLFSLLRRSTGALWRSGFVAALFALHPLHVESVAWVAERKDVLSTLFFLLACRTYAAYVDRPGWGRYLGVAGFFCLGLLAKPSVVTLPLALLLLDYWPLRRTTLGAGFAGRAPVPLSRLLLEKVPLLLPAAAVAAVAYGAQRAGDAVSDFSWGIRGAHVLNAYAGYLGKMLWPGSLAVFYPFSGENLSGAGTAGAVALLAAVSAFALVNLRSRPYLATGWFWYLGTLAPSSGIVQIGAHSMADRYTYIPLIGLFVAIAWGACDLVPRWRHRGIILAAPAALAVAALAVVSWSQVGHWRDSEALFTHALDVTKDNWVAHYNLALVLQRQGRHREAIPHYLEMMRIVPELPATASNLARARNNLGVALNELGDTSAAAAQFRESLRLQPHDANAARNLESIMRRRAGPGAP